MHMCACICKSISDFCECVVWMAHHYALTLDLKFQVNWIKKLNQIVSLFVGKKQRTPNLFC